MMRTWLSLAMALVALGVAGCDFPYPAHDTEQIGFRGTGMELVTVHDADEELMAANTVPDPLPAVPSAGPKASDVYQNVQVLGDLSVAEFTRLMAAMTQWVSPEGGCNYCHEANLASDNLYTKVVSRRMLQMTKHINGQWSDHVAQTGVTCYTCHRGQPVPAEIWFQDPGPKGSQGRVGFRAGQNMAAPKAAYASLPLDPFSPFLVNDDNPIRVGTTTALPTNNRTSIKQTEWTYSLMMHMSDALGQNCTFCHNSRSFGSWENSTPQRVTAWHGIQMVRDLNNQFLVPLQDTYPDKRLGELGDAPKANCATCHQGAPKPLLGQSMLPDYPSLAGSE